MNEKETPLLKQYNSIKNKYPDTVLLFRLGDFFETFNEDAKITASVCGITLTKRNNGAAGNMPLAGFPHHQLDNYLPKLVRAGYRVAVCEQTEDPKKAKGIVKRDVVEVITPGAVLYDKLLDTKKNNYLLSLNLGKINSNWSAGIACLDISTGEFFVSEIEYSLLTNVLESLTPSEIIINKSQKIEIQEIIDNVSNKPAITKLENWMFDVEFSREALLGHFGTQSLKGFGIENFTLAIAAAGSLLSYIKDTQKGRIEQITGIYIYNPSEYMSLDYSTRRNLEITYSMSDTGRDGSLISILDKTSTPMGGRLFKKWLSRPLINLSKIHERLEAVREIINSEKQNSFKSQLSEIGDIERIISRICAGKATPRDLIALKISLEKIPSVSELIINISSKTLDDLRNELNPLTELCNLINDTILEEPSTHIGSGAIFKKGFNTELDEYIEAKYNGKKWIVQFQENERTRTGISTLKVAYNGVFGYYIEISHANRTKVPDDYERKQTLTNAERYITNELKQFEQKILSAEEKINEIEQNLFSDLLIKISSKTSEIQQNAYILSQIDCLNSFAVVSTEYNYVEPIIDDSKNLLVEDGRHPVVERLLPIGESFQSNPTKLDPESEMIHIITGPNMAGKSCYLRQVGLIVYLGQIGCFVPAKSATFGIVDRIFTRVGAQDNITAGESTFLIEMQEAANIMNNASSRSLILLDEIGRGTATFDGIAIAWAITEYIHNVIGAKTLFATHYHELNELAGRYENISNYKVDVLETGSKLIFTHKLLPGGSDHSFGIHVAQMAGLPKEIINRANDIMKNLEELSTDSDSTKSINTEKIETNSVRRLPEQLAIFEIRDDFLRDKLLSLNINSLTPVDALQILFEMQKDIKKGKSK
jgi:DNA mismatch repair protein MutS